jgi:ribosomal subunit interface protein
MKTTIKSTRITLDDELKQHIEDKLLTLAKYAPQAVALRIELELTTHHHRKGEIYRAEMNVDLPKKVVRVEVYSEKPLAAIELLKDEMKKALLQLKKRQLTENKQSAKEK